VEQTKLEKEETIAQLQRERDDALLQHSAHAQQLAYTKELSAQAQKDRDNLRAQNTMLSQQLASATQQQIESSEHVSQMRNAHSELQHESYPLII
jgi:hypothetical protein